MSYDPELERQLLAAHRDGDLSDIAAQYARAADQAEAANDVNRACFYLTHAWIFALEAGDRTAEQHHTRLAAWGRV